MDVVKDYTFNKSHAQDLIDNIRDYWRMRGYTKYKFWLKPITVVTTSGKTYVRYEVDSNIVVRAPTLDEI